MGTLILLLLLGQMMGSCNNILKEIALRVGVNYSIVRRIIKQREKEILYYKT